MADGMLEIVQGRAAGRRLLVHGELAIGRGEPGDGRLGDDPLLSRRHARIFRDPEGRLTLEDLGSSNGTFVNGARIEGTRPLSGGDTVRLGETELRVGGAAAPPPPTGPPLPAAPPAPLPAPVPYAGGSTPRLDLPAGSNLAVFGINGVEGLTVDQVNDELAQGARFVVFPYVISLLIITLRRGSGIFYIRPGQRSIAKGLPYFGVSLLLGWWGFPWGFIFTPIALVRALTGGKNVTAALVSALNANSAQAAGAVAAAAAAEGPRSGVLQMPAQPAQQPLPPPPPPPVSPQPAAPAPGWLPDPHGQARLRYWDGAAWTPHTAP